MNDEVMAKIEGLHKLCKEKGIAVFCQAREASEEAEDSSYVAGCFSVPDRGDRYIPIACLQLVANLLEERHLPKSIEKFMRPVVALATRSLEEMNFEKDGE